jgi:hemin uptake protein HemP
MDAGPDARSAGEPDMTLQPKTIEIDPDMGSLPTYDARHLVLGGDQARIVFEDKVYNLRITRAGKLILTK